MTNLTLLAVIVPEIWRASQNFKSRSRDPFLAPLGPIFLFLSLVLLVIKLHEKFDVSSSIRSRDMEGSQNFKLGHVTPFRPVNGGSAMTPYLNSLTPTCLV